MDIGPVRRRLTAEPISSPVPGEDPAVHEPPAPAPEHVPAGDTVAATDR